MSKKYIFRILILLSLIFSLVACTRTTNEAEHDHETDHTGETEPVERIPNEGAAVHITAPEDGTTVKIDEDVMVEIEMENFEIGDDAGHWHVYVDGASWGMVMGENTSQVLRGLEPGEHEISVYLSNHDHEELKDGDTIHIIVQ